MGGNMSCICAQPAESKFQVEEIKREKVMQQATANFKPFRTRKKKKKKLKLLELPPELVLPSLARTYLMKRYFDAARLLRSFKVLHRLLFTPLPVRNEIILLEQKLPVYKVKTITSKNLKFIPAVELADGGYYEGQWDIHAEGLEGSGTRIYIDHSKFTGYFHDWKRNLFGRHIHLNGDIYEGEYDGDSMQGKGVLLRNNGTKYTGDFEKDLESGKGVLEFNGTIQYEGDFSQGMKHGKGKYLMKDGNIYEGVFKNNTMDGYGKFTWVDGVEYLGQWKNNKFHGEGLQTWPDGRRYKGYYVEGLRSGYGEFVWPDGREYKGNWLNDQMHNEGFFTFIGSSSKPKTLKSHWNNGKRVKWL